QLEDLSTRPDLLSLKSDIESAEAEAGIARKTALPEFEVQARRSPWTDPGGVYGGRLQLTWSLYDHGRSKLETQAAMKKADAARASYDDARS
ncbi:TolC family protein, partial [Acinetobacter baumannii]